jgi:hypothetical protein
LDSQKQFGAGANRGAAGMKTGRCLSGDIGFEYDGEGDDPPQT